MSADSPERTQIRKEIACLSSIRGRGINQPKYVRGHDWVYPTLTLGDTEYRHCRKCDRAEVKFGRDEPWVWSP
jgi:hypothetical protein